MFRSVTLYIWLILLVVIAPLGGNAQEQNSAAASKASTLKERVEAYWQAREAGDQVQAFVFEEVNVNGTRTLQDYVRGKRNAVFQQVKVLNVEILGPKKAIARVFIKIIVSGLKDPVADELEDEWVYIDGQWYHHYKNKKYG